MEHICFISVVPNICETLLGTYKYLEETECQKYNKLLEDEVKNTLHLTQCQSLKLRFFKGFLASTCIIFLTSGGLQL